MRKRSRNNIAVARLGGRRQWRDPMDQRKWQRLTAHRLINLMDHPQVSLRGHLRGRA